MSVEGRYRLIRAAMDALPMIELIAGPSYPGLNWLCAMKVAELTA